jgi:hypothetical protein
MRRPLPPFPARSARGGITWVTALLLTIVAAGAYVAWTWGPVYILHYEVKQVVRDYMNQAVKDPNDQQLVQDMLHKLRVLDGIDGLDESGRRATVPTVQVAAEDVTWERNTLLPPPSLHVAFAYTRPVRYPLLERWTQATLSVDLTADLTRPDWGPMR